MSDFGTHSTQYAGLSDDELYGMYREEVFLTLTNEQKLELGQETINRDAHERGMIGAPKLSFTELPEEISGQSLNGSIEVNESILSHNGNFLNTIIHENIHAYQEQVIDGTITEMDETLAVQYRANATGIGSAVFHNGTYQIGSHYMKGLSAPECAAVQATERDAMKGAEEKTAAIIHSLTEKYGADAGFEKYEADILEKGYQTWENAGIEHFQNPDFERDVNQILLNQYFQDDVLVDENIENAVKGEMIASYQALMEYENTESLTGLEEKDMGEEYETQCMGMMPEGSGEIVDVEIQEIPDITDDLEYDDGLDW